MGVILKFENNASPLAANVKADRDFNKECARKLEAFWASLGHNVKYEVTFLEKLNVHKIHTDDIKNGLPCKERLTPIARKRLTQLP